MTMNRLRRIDFSKNLSDFSVALAPQWPPGLKKKPLIEVRGEFKQGGFTSGRREGSPGGMGGPSLFQALRPELPG